MSKRIELYPNQVVDHDYSNGRLVVTVDGGTEVVRACNVLWLTPEDSSEDPQLRLVSSLSAMALEASSDVSAPQLQLVEGEV